MDSNDTPHGLDRRALFGLAAGAAAIAGEGLAAPAAGTPASPRYVERGPGTPVVTPVIETTNGRVQGLISNAILAFKGIRYGAAPVGELRWAPPQRPDRWDTIEDCSSYGAPAIQEAGGITAAPTTDFGMQMGQVFSTPSELKIQNEDCLFLNVWTPGVDARKRPVMVWIHGGGFAYGSGGQPIYSCEGLARFGDVVSVSLNHRLNVFGYLHLGDAFGPAYASSGTVGMQDLVLALEWVRDNIARFGGDPGNVTIMGQSGGGAKVSTLLAMPSAKGLFHKASIQSGPALMVGTKEQAAAATTRLLAELGVSAGDLKALQAIPPQKLVAAAAKVRAAGGPIIDGVAITHHPFTPGAPDESLDVPILVGWVKDEPTIFTAGEPWFGTMTEADLAERIKPMGEDGQKLLAALRKAYPTYTPTYLWSQFGAMRAMVGSQLLAERKQVNLSHRVRDQR